MSDPLLTDEQRKQLDEHRAARIEQYVRESRKAAERLKQDADKLVLAASSTSQGQKK